MLNFSDFIQVYVFITNHHLKSVFSGECGLTRVTQILELFKHCYVHICFMYQNKLQHFLCSLISSPLIWDTAFIRL